jgi:hypothetical protein
MNESRLENDDSVDAELRALDAALAEFVSQSTVTALRPDGMSLPFTDATPSAPASTGARVALQPEPAKPVIPMAPNPRTEAPLPSAAPVRRWPAALPLWRPRGAFLWGLLAVAIAGCVGTAVGWWLATGTPPQVPVPERLVVQTPHPPKPLVRTSKTPQRAVRTRQRQHPVTPAPTRAPFAAVRPERQSPPKRRPLPLAAVPPLPVVSMVMVARPPIVDPIPELVAPLPGPEAITPPRILYQELPRPRVIADSTVSVLLVVLINVHGAVDRAFIGSAPLMPSYERQLVDAAKTWRYTPALQNGRPIPYRKTLRVTVPAAGPPR